MAATRSQKIRLGIFLIVSTTILLSSLVYLVGASMFKIRDEYIVVLHGGSGGIEAGGQVRFNDIVVGRVERVRLDRDDPSRVIVNISLEHDTPVTADTIATPEMTGITGSKMLSLRGGSKTSQRLKPGDEIPSAESDLSHLTTKLFDISTKLERLLENLVNITDTDNAQRLASVLADVESMSTNLSSMVASNAPLVGGLMVDLRSLLANADVTLTGIQSTVRSAEQAVTRISSQQNIRRVENIIDGAGILMANLSARTSEDELGRTIASINRLATDTNVSVMRIRDDLRRIMVELETSVENINEFTQILIDNPSVLISGRSEKERRLP
ncbi:MAG: MlaD family protein [Proteobacteria bacterium]|nr:MlaD family protein [Pseudomonadota bacterium]